MKYAHLTDEKKQTIYEHLTGVAQKAADNANDMMRSLAYTAGLTHDIGKYAIAFQKRLFGDATKYEHSVCGAIELGKLAKNNLEVNMTYMLQFCVAGHHTGLPDGGTGADCAQGDSTLHARIKRRNLYTGEADYMSYRDEIKFSLPDYSEIIKELNRSENRNDFFEKYAFFTRYLFSCLTDADFIDTEKFYAPQTDRLLSADFEMAEAALDKRLSSFICDTPLKRARNTLQKQAIANGMREDKISILNMPTGSGKTLCSMKIALEKLIKHKKKRIIYVIPYTSIIEQTAEIFENLFGEYADIVQHHSNYCYDTDSDDTAKKLKRSTENWDAPIIITTAVQFFQSIYHYKGSGLRKLHNIADSVIVFDEVHMLPLECLQPCLRGIGYVTKYLNSEAIFLSATMPDYSAYIKKYIGECSVAELIKDTSAFSYFKKCTYSFIGKIEAEVLAMKAAQYNSSLIIVNSRKAARDIYRLLSGKKYHLSTYMTPFDRSEVIRQIRSDLQNNNRITVVSTSLVEAGVDLDFEAVFRELAGLDNILQSGGRCNREGKMESGNVYIFETEATLSDDLKIKASIVRDILDEGKDISDGECIREYYSRLFKYSDKLIDSNTIANNLSGPDNIPFRTYAENFKFIKDETISVVIDNNDETADLLSQLKSGGKNIKRKLQRYSVSLRLNSEFSKALSLGIISETEDGIFVLANNEYYNSETGFDLDKASDCFFV